MVVVLDSGFFSSLDCSQQMGATFVAAFVAQIAIVAGLSAFVVRPYRNGPALETIGDPLFFRGGDASLGQLGP